MTSGLKANNISMKQSRIIIILISALVILCCFVLIKNNDLFSGVHTVELRESGFFPDQIQIEKDEEIRFINKTKKPFWPASNPHPDHTTYQDFDSRQPIAPGESWIFKFETEGIFLYHNHLYALDDGAVIVGKNNEIMDTANFDMCKNRPDKEKRTCFELLLKNTLQNNPQDGLELFKKLVEVESNDCHQYAHDFGEYVAQNDHSGEKIKIGIESSYCGYGFWHGFTTQILRDFDLQTAEQYCENTRNPDPVLLKNLKSNCYHGLGIGLIQDPPPVEFWGNAGPLIDSALESCDQLKDEWKRDCYSGVFHPMADYMARSQYSFAFNEEEPFALCLEQKEHHRPECYYQIAAKLAHLVDYNLEEGFELIQKIPTELEREYTFTLAMINFVNHQMSNEELVGMFKRCQNLATSDSCLAGILHTIFANGAVEKAQIRSFDICNSEDLGDNHRLACFKNSIKILRLYYNEQKVQEICAPLEVEYSNVCAR